MQPTIETLRPGDEAARADLARLAFGAAALPNLDRPSPPNEHITAAYLGDRLVGAATFYDEAQWFGGRAVRSGGVAAVCVSPDQRGRDIARRVVTEALRRMHERGDAISALYPTTATLYRSLGYEIAGWWLLTDISVGQLRNRELASPTVVIEPGSRLDVDATYDLVSSAHDGWLQRSPRFRSAMTFDFDHATEPKAIYRASRDGALVGAISYREVREGAGRTFDLSTDTLVAADRETLRALLSLVGAHGTMAQALRTTLPPHVLVHAVPHAQQLRSRYQFPWMLRMIDVTRAIAQRGFPPELALEVHVELTGDTQLPHNNGRFVLEVRDGQGRVSPGGRGDVVLDVRDFAALFTGLGDGPRALRLAFCGRPPSLVDFF